MKLENKVAIVTGAGRGIGEGIARKLACEGATVVCADRNLEDASAVAEACGGQSCAVQVDVANACSCDVLVGQVVERFGRVDILVNNAGINRDAMMHKMTDQQWDDVIAVDLSGVFYMTRAASRSMREARAGRIINISSVSSAGNIGQGRHYSCPHHLVCAHLIPADLAAPRIHVRSGPHHVSTRARLSTRGPS